MQKVPTRLARVEVATEPNNILVGGRLWPEP